MVIKKPANALRILHTADWHLGKRLIEQTRYEEFGAFLDWLIDCIDTQAVDVLVVAGDIFDTMTPSNKAQELYYNFLARLNHTNCQHAIIVAGNHDSPSFLDAPKALFRHFNIYVVGTVTSEITDEILVLNDKNNNPALIVAAAPYLRERDIRTGDSLTLSDKETATAQGISKHYQTLATHAKDKQNQLLSQNSKPTPLLATGHLFATGASIAADNDGMRNLYVGSLGQIGADIFAGFDYVALGHIHREQMVGKQSHIRYSGSPMAFCFDEQNQDKKVLIVDFAGDTTPTVTPIILPKFRELYQFVGDFETIKNQIIHLKNSIKETNIQQEIWLNIECSPPKSDLKEKLDELIKDLPISIIAYKNKNPQISRNHQQNTIKKSLNELTVNDVFDELLLGIEHNNQKLKANEQFILSNEQKQMLKQLYEQVVFDLENDDKMAI